MTPLDRKLSPLIAVSTILVLVLLLYWGKPVLMPLALALLFSFLLNPVVNALHRRGLPRGPAVMTVVLLVFTIVAGVAWAIGHQMNALAEELPQYKENVVKKIAELRTAGKGTGFEKLQRTVQEVIGELKRQHRTEKSSAVEAEA